MGTLNGINPQLVAAICSMVYLDLMEPLRLLLRRLWHNWMDFIAACLAYTDLFSSMTMKQLFDREHILKNVDVRVQALVEGLYIYDTFRSASFEVGQEPKLLITCSRISL
ncbi:unnamed protein product [Brassica rapa subsp. trilocularis]